MTQFGTQPPGPLTIEWEQLDVGSTATKTRYAVAGFDYYGARIDQTGIALYPATGAMSQIVNNGDGTYTIDRPAGGSGRLQISVVASAPGYNSATTKFYVQPQDVVIVGTPILIVTPTDNPTTVSFAYSSTATSLTWSLNGVNQGAVGASPLVVSKNASGGAVKVVRMTATNSDGGTAPYGPYNVPAQAVASGGTIPGTGATQTTPWGYSTASQADKISATVEQLRQIAITDGKMT